MSDQPAIGIFARSPSIAAYLAEIAAMVGIRASLNDASAEIILVAGGMYAYAKNDANPPVIRLDLEGFTDNNEVHESDKRIFAPIRAGLLAFYLKKALKDAFSVPDAVKIGDGILDARESLWRPRDGEAIRLTDKEVGILLCLAAAKGSSVNRQELLEQVWAYAEGVETHTLETHIYRLRQKIEPDPANPSILFTTGQGYSLNAPGQA